VNDVALTKVREDKLRESGDGFDGTWVAHPDLVPTALEIFDEVLGQRPNQKERLRAEVNVAASALVAIRVPGGQLSEAGIRANVAVAIQYLAAWLSGNGAAAINNLMEDAATAEIARAQLWQWVKHGAWLEDGRKMSVALYETVRMEELTKLGENDSYRQAANLLDQLVLSPTFTEFLTLPAYQLLD
jgi:malate synthase